MSDEKISRTVESIEDVRQEDTVCVNEHKAKTRKHWYRIAAAAAVVAILLTALLWPRSDDNYVTDASLLAVRAYALDRGNISEENSAIMEEGIEFTLGYAWANGMSCAFGLPIRLSVNDERLEGSDIQWEVSVEHGEFYLDSDAVKDQVTEDTSWTDLAYLGNHFEVENNTLIQWINYSLHTDGPPDFYLGKKTFVEAIVRADGHIVGYAVIEIRGQYRVKNYGGCSHFLPVLLEANYYPPVDGECQDVSLQYVQKQIRKAKRGF